MKQLELVRDAWSDKHTFGTMMAGTRELQTIERPWINTYPGGKPFESCIPAGNYLVTRYQRPNGDVVPILSNPGHAVYEFEDQRHKDVGRYLILMHPANWAHQVNGCIAPGMARATSHDGHMVTSSRKAFQHLMDWLGDEPAELLIKWYGREPFYEGET